MPIPDMQTADARPVVVPQKPNFPAGTLYVECREFSRKDDSINVTWLGWDGTQFVLDAPAGQDPTHSMAEAVLVGNIGTAIDPNTDPVGFLVSLRSIRGSLFSFSKPKTL